MNSLDVFTRDIKRYVDYIFETKGFTSDFHPREVSAQAIQSAKTIRGIDREPAIIIQGIMPRSGTVYVGELLRLHPELYTYPYQLWEVPALQLTGDILKLQKKFLLSYKPGMHKLKEDDFLPLFGASLIAHLYGPVPSPQRVLVKAPSVQYLTHFFSMFPHENLLILIRDGRDLVHSTLRTWPRLNFLQVCLRWNRSARIILNTLEYLKTNECNKYCLVRYEDALQEPVSFVKEICKHFKLKKDCYPFDQIDNIRVIGSSKLAGDGQVTWQHVKKPENFKPVEYWKQWSAAKKLIFKLIAGQSLIDLGYCKDLNW